MERFKISHIREQGIDLIIVPVNPSFSYMNHMEQNRVTHVLQSAALRAGLAGTVVPVWDAGHGRMGFLAPTAWHPFFRNISLDFVATKINRELIIDQPSWQTSPPSSL
jgi:hypothetical protein